ncbi:MAG TPA: HEPN domain-containing protein [Beijerinckiaceae bacterium]|jgi:uncharacterized protein (UPF0332 family)
MSDLWAKVDDAAEEARILQRSGMTNGVVSRSYYACFTAARALVVERLSAEESDFRRHAAVLRRFSELFVKTGEIETELSRGLRLLFEDRADADYADQRSTLDEALEALAFMERFLAAVKPLRRTAS